MTSGHGTVGYLGPTGMLVLMLTMTASIAQIAPATSGSPAFYSPSRHSPFNLFITPTAVIPAHHHHLHGPRGTTTNVDGEPC